MRRKRRPITLTRRGENVLAVAYTLLILIGCAAVLLLMLGIAGWVEGL
jgi:hypothetical protein